MNADKERLKMLLTETIALLCQRGLTFSRELHVQGLLGVTVDDDVFLVPVDSRTSNNAKQSVSVNHETEASSPRNLMLRHHDSSAHQVAPSEVLDTNQTPDDTQPLLSQHSLVNDKLGLPAVTKTEADDADSSTENESQLSTNPSHANVFASQLGHPPIRFEQPFPTAAFGFGNLTTVAEVHAANDEVGRERKRKRKPCKFGDDMLVLSSDNDEWTNNSQREVDEPVAGCSQWTNFGEDSPRDIAVSVLRG